MDTFHLLTDLRKLEQGVAYYTPPPLGKRPFAYQLGSLPVLLSAPHGAAHRRNGRLKEEDEYTTALARFVATKTGAHALYATYQSDTDPNWDKDAPYKEALRQIVRRQQVQFVLDLHGMSNRHKIGLALGTINGRSCPTHEPHIVQFLQRQAFKQATQRQAQQFPQLQPDSFVLNHSRFTGGVKNHTVTRFVSQELGVAAAQLELCSTVRVVQRGPHGQAHKWPRPFAGDPQAIQRTVNMLISLVQQLV